MIFIDDQEQMNIREARPDRAIPEKEEDVSISDATDIILNSILYRIEHALSPDKWEQFIKLLRQNAPSQDLIAFLKTDIPFFEKALLEEMLRFVFIKRATTQAQK